MHCIYILQYRYVGLLVESLVTTVELCLDKGGGGVLSCATLHNLKVILRPKHFFV
jgi:hypothetical protein